VRQPLWRSGLRGADALSRHPRRIGAMKKLIILALLVALGVVAARRLREA
jgi:hypothetical protein